MNPVRLGLLASLVLGTVVYAKDLTIAVIPKGTTHEFWKSVHAGAVKAERELTAAGTPVKLFWKGPLREDDRDQQIQVVENFTARNVSGIVLAPLDSQALVNPVRSAVKAGVPVVIFDSDLKSDQQVSFVATDNFKGGRIAGDYLAQRLGGKGKVILLRIIGSQIQSEDGVPQAALFQAAERMQALVELTARQAKENKALRGHIRRITDRASVLDDQLSRLIQHCNKHGVHVSSQDITGEAK